jgi:hypothetical protein
MGRSIVPVGAVASLDEKVRAGGNAFDVQGVRYSAERRGAVLTHREVAKDATGLVVAQTEVPVSHVIGSGTHAFSYLIDHDGILTQSPLTWYTQKTAFDLSPGFATQIDKFERPIVPGCLFCHANRADPVPDSLNKYRQPIFQGFAIGCERCHGPGEWHVQERTAGKPVLGELDDTIVNPSALPPGLRDDVCSQCHLGGKERVLRRRKQAFDYRPGLPLDEFWRVFVLPTGLSNGNRVAGHVEQMGVSRCFVKSAGAMGCVSCHDPHVMPAAAKKETYYRKKCLECHAKQGCSEPRPARLAKTKGDDCTVCHMPRSESNVGHVALTDHRILRRPDPSIAAGEPDPSVAARRLVPFGRDSFDDRDPELTRDRAVALVNRARHQSESVRIEIARATLADLDRTVRAHPDDLPARECLGVSLAWAGNLEASLAECEATLARAPKREQVLSDAGLTAQRLGLGEKSLGYWRRALEINPSSSRYRYEVANALAAGGNWPAAVAECRKVLDANGGHIPSRLLIMQFHWLNGAKDSARAEFVAILALHPPNETFLRTRFAEILR